MICLKALITKYCMLQTYGRIIAHTCSILFVPYCVRWSGSAALFVSNSKTARFSKKLQASILCEICYFILYTNLN